MHAEPMPQYFHLLHAQCSRPTVQGDPPPWKRTLCMHDAQTHSQQGSAGYALTGTAGARALPSSVGSPHTSTTVLL